MPRLVTGNPEGAMNWHKWVAAFFVTQALVGCALAVTGQGKPPYAPYSHEDRNDRGPDM